jgi:predicted nucleic acid-binding protein
MEIVTDVSAIMAVLLYEPERDAIIAVTEGHEIVGPKCIPWEVGNAFSVAIKRRRITLRKAVNALTAFETIPIRYFDTDIIQAIRIASRYQVYAYDAYYLECAVRHRKPLLTLDCLMMSVGKKWKLKSWRCFHEYLYLLGSEAEPGISSRCCEKGR